MGRRVWGIIDKRAPGSWRARYTVNGIRYTVKPTFPTKDAADAALSKVRAAIAAGTWAPPGAPAPPAPPLLSEWAVRWIEARDLRDSTREKNRSLLARRITPTLGRLTLDQITRPVVAAWHAEMGTEYPTARSDAYRLLRAIMNGAVEAGIIDDNPCKVKGGGSVKPARGEPATVNVSEVARLVESMPDRLRIYPALAGWCALRAGEIRELRRRDIDTEMREITISRTVTWVGGAHTVGPSKTAVTRVVPVPDFAWPVIEHHLNEHTGPGSDALLLVGADGTSHISRKPLQKAWERARLTIGRPDLHFHDLRHSAATAYAMAGATTADLKSLGGWTSDRMPAHYVHSARARLRQVAEAIPVPGRLRVIEGSAARKTKGPDGVEAAGPEVSM